MKVHVEQFSYGDWYSEDDRNDVTSIALVIIFIMQTHSSMTIFLYQVSFLFVGLIGKVHVVKDFF